MIASLRARLLTPRGLTWLGGLFIAVVVVLATLDIARSYYRAVDNTGRELDAHARTIAEQTARTFQAIDLQLRQLARQYQRGTLAALSDDELRAYLKEYAAGLVQIEGLLLVNADGTVRASSYMTPEMEAGVNVGSQALTRIVRAGPTPFLVVTSAEASRFDGKLMFPMGRRLESPQGEFAGMIAARGRIDYFEAFYRDIRLDEGTRIALLHQDGTLIARHPRAEKVIGKRLPQFEKLLASHEAGEPPTTRTVSPVDGVDRFGALHLVPDYPLAIVVTRDAAAALAAWRTQSLRTALRTIALSVLAALLLAVTIRQLSRLNAASRSLELSQERFAAAVGGSDDGIWDWDYASGEAFASPRARELMGMPPGPETQPEQEWFDAASRQIHPEDAPRRNEAIRAHLAGQTPAYECDFRVRNPDGSYRWVRVRGMCVRKGGKAPHRMAGSISDIDAAKRAAEALRRSEERFALAVSGSNDGIVDWDVVNDRMYSSERAMQIMGVESGVTVRTRAQWSALVKYHPDDVQRMKDDLNSFLEGHTELRDGEYRVLLPDGKYRWIRHRNKCVRDSSGKPLRVAGSVSDIEPQKRAESERLRLEGQLLQAKKLEAIGTLAGGIAHDFNNILAAILGYGEMAQKQASEGTALRRHIDATVSAGMRAKSLVERILAFSRSGIGERKPVHVQSVVTEALDLAAASLPAHVGLERRLEAGDAAVMGDATQIHQVVMNLCANGAQAMKAKGSLSVVLDVVEKQDSMAATSALAAGRYVRLAVRDTGEGIAPQVIERIFDPFFTTKEVGVGTGLGLSLVHGIVTDLGGGIDVDSRPGQGTTFTVYLPWSAAAAASAGVEEAVPNGSGETILLVDDEEALVRLGEEMIAGMGYEPVGFTSSTAALAAFRAEPDRFNAVLSDEAMPELTGSELAREIRAIRPGMPVVLMSGFVSPALSSRAREIGVVEVLNKPVVAREIARSLANALHNGRRP